MFTRDQVETMVKQAHYNLDRWLDQDDTWENALDGLDRPDIANTVGNRFAKELFAIIKAETTPVVKG